MYKLGDIKLDFTDIPHPKKKKLRSRNSWAGRQNYYVQKVQIGQIIQPQSNTVEFIGRVGRKCVGLGSFQYDDLGSSTEGQRTRSSEDEGEDTDEEPYDEVFEESDDSDGSEGSVQELFVRT